MIQKRQYNIDLLRILACFMVVMLHVAADKWYNVPYTSFEWKVYNVYNTAVRSSVPLFFMMSGMLFLSKESISVERLFKKNISKLVILYFLWSVLYAVDRLNLDVVLFQFNGREFFDTVMLSKYHLWFLPSLASVYLILPIIHPVKDRDDGRLMYYLLGFFFLFGIVKPTLNVFDATADLGKILGKFEYLFSYYAGYFVLGYVLHKNYHRIRIKSGVLLLILALVIVITAAGNYMLSDAKGERVSSMYNNYFISTFIEACIIYVLFLRMKTDKISEKAGKLIRKFSDCTLFVYLFHPFVINQIGGHLGIHTLAFNPIFSVPLVAILVFIICLAVGFVVSKIPYVNKILI